MLKKALYVQEAQRTAAENIPNFLLQTESTSLHTLRSVFPQVDAQHNVFPQTQIY